MRDYDEDDSEEFDDRDRNRTRSPRFPGTVMASGIIWIGFGTLNLLGTMLIFANVAANPGARPTAPCCAGGIGIAFLVCGLQTVLGKASDTLGNSIGSLVFGLIYMLLAAGVAAFGGAVVGKQNAANDAEMLFLVIFLGSIGFTLEVAALLGFMGRTAYRDWREAAAPRRGRRQPRRRDEDDADDS